MNIWWGHKKTGADILSTPVKEIYIMEKMDADLFTFAKNGRDCPLCERNGAFCYVGVERDCHTV